MKRKIYLAVVIFASLTIVGCTNSKKTNLTENSVIAEDKHNAVNSLDYYGEYKGTIPAADCPGIEVTIILNKDNTYTQQYIYIDRKNANFNESGTFEVDGNLLTTTNKDGNKSYYKVEEGRVRMLDSDKQPITGDLADMYILKQEKVF